MEIISEFGFRQDGRKPTELRRIRTRLGVYGQADGSAYVEQGLTKVLCAVYGPHEPRGRGRQQIQENIDKAFVNCQYSAATFSTAERKFRPRGDRKSTEMSALLRKTFESTLLTSVYPRSQIDIFCEVLQSDGSNLAACINAASLALMDAGVPMRGVASAISVGCQNETPVIDVNQQEESGGQGANVTMALLPHNQEIVLLEINSKIHVQLLESVMDAAMQGCKDIGEILKREMTNRVNHVSCKLGLE